MLVCCLCSRSSLSLSLSWKWVDARRRAGRPPHHVGSGRDDTEQPGSSALVSLLSVLTPQGPSRTSASGTTVEPGGFAYIPPRPASHGSGEQRRMNTDPNLRRAVWMLAMLTVRVLARACRCVLLCSSAPEVSRLFLICVYIHVSISNARVLIGIGSTAASHRGFAMTPIVLLTPPSKNLLERRASIGRWGGGGV